ncbi:MbeD/MobD family mobilization/exclusion protein [Candidatus Williamhamiltonella defendens]
MRSERHKSMRGTYSSLQRMLETTSQALEHNDRVCQNLSNQVNGLYEQVERLSSDLSRLMRS